MINFLKYKWIYFLISGMFLCIGLFSIITFGFNFSIDFTGGSVIEYKISKKITKQKIRSEFSQNAIKVISVDEGKNNQFTLRTASIDEIKEAKVRSSIENNSGATVKMLRFETVGPSLGKETIKKTFIASIVAIFGILLYISYTFRKLNYGLAATVATVHDFLILLGMYSLLSHFYHGEVDSLFVTAILTTMSFSVHDTIVVFDKIREYRKISALKTEVLANKALTETMVRSINNSLTIVLMLIPLVVLGTDSIRFFAVALLIGTITGTYSSPFIATPLLVILEKKK